MTDQVTVKDQKLRDQHWVKLGKKLVKANKVSIIETDGIDNEISYKVIDSVKLTDESTFDDEYFKTVKVIGNKIHCEITCSQFKWERNRHPNCKHVQAVMLFENKKFKTIIPIEWEILFLQSNLKTKNTTANYLKESIMQKQLKLNEIAKSTIKIQKEILELTEQSNA